jgi:hypothetical protein
MSNGFEITSEQEESGCWIFVFQLSGREHEKHEFRLSWEDYDLWAPSGSVEPSIVARAALVYITTRDDFEPIPARIDSSRPRHLNSSADAEIVALIDPGSFKIG